MVPVRLEIVIVRRRKPRLSVRLAHREMRNGPRIRRSNYLRFGHAQKLENVLHGRQRRPGQRDVHQNGKWSIPIILRPFRPRISLCRFYTNYRQNIPGGGGLSVATVNHGLQEMLKSHRYALKGISRVRFSTS